MSDQNSNPASEAKVATMAVTERTLNDERYRHMGSERESHLQAIRGMKRRSLVFDDDFPGSWWEPVANDRYGPEQPTENAVK